MGEETFADYMLGEKDWGKKLEIMYYLKKRTGIYYDNSVIFKTLITKMFLSYLNENVPEVKVDDNIVVTARLLLIAGRIRSGSMNRCSMKPAVKLWMEIPSAASEWRRIYDL